MKQTLLRQLPKVDEVLMRPEIEAALLQAPRSLVVDAIREQLETLRQTILSSEPGHLPEALNVDGLVSAILKQIGEEAAYSLKPVINATGVVLHTNLGRSLMAPSLMPQLEAVACGYSTLEYNTDTGARGSRYTHVESLICKLTGAEAAIVVNNNAAAVMLVLDTLAKGKEVIVSRGQLVEIGGSFRIPDVMKRSQATLIEVGTTNKTHLKDYAEAITPETGALMKVHTSNYKIMGFTKETETSELAELAQSHNIPLIEDLGSGMLIDLSRFGLTKEPTVQESLQSGVDVVTFSGDKLLGGPQGGIIVGRKALIDRMKKNQLTRALRVDKLTLCCLEGTLQLYLDEAKALKEIPTLRMLGMTYQETRIRALDFMMAGVEHGIFITPNEGPTTSSEDSTADEGSTAAYVAFTADDYSEVGGGSMPTERMPSKVLRLKPLRKSAQSIADALRQQPLPVIVRLQNDEVVVDFRTVQDSEMKALLNGLAEAGGVQ